MISIQDLSFIYPGSDQPALDRVTLQIAAGQLCLVMGASGSGKSTLLRCINGLVPHFSGGNIQGKIRVNGLDPVCLSPREMSGTVGFVFQDPEAQFVVDRVEDEIAFSLENAALSEADMEMRLEEACRLLELDLLKTRRLETLSGGERQRVAIAAALALRPKILLLDEPTSQLDPHSADEVLQMITRLNKQLELTVVLAEHRLERILPYTGQIIYLSQDVPGCLVGEPREILSKVSLNPPLVQLGKIFEWEPLPLTVEEAKEWVHRLPGKSPRAHEETLPAQTILQGVENLDFIQATNVHVNYGNLQALKGVDFHMARGEIVVMMGPNGAGKSTLMRCLVGLVPAQEGNIQVDGKDIHGRSVAEICQQVGYLPQDPNALLFADTVMEELLITLRNHHLEYSDRGDRPAMLLKQLGLAEKAADYPRDLSSGERQRVAMGAVMVTHPGALLLDEPTRGLDYHAKQALLVLLRQWRDEGMAILLVTHDVELGAQAADRIVLMEDGLITADGSPGEVLANSAAFSTQVARIFPGRGWITVNDVLGGMDGSQH